MSKKRADGRTNLGRFSRGRSGNPSGLPKKRTDSAPADPQKRADEWTNFTSGLGVYGRDKRIGTQFQLNPFSFDQLRDLWLGDDLAARAVETIPKESLRQGYDIVVHTSEDSSGSDTGFDATELASEVQQKLEVLGADEYLETVGNYERGYGGGALLLGANDGQADLTKPLDLRRVRSLDWLTPLEARELLPLYAYNDPRAPKYGQPEIYQMQSRGVLPSYSGNYAATTQLVHESRLIVFPGIRVSRYQTSVARGGWGEAVLTRVHRVLRDFNQAWSSAGVLVSDFAQSVIKIAGLWEAVGQDGQQAFQKQLQVMEYGRAVTNAVTIDADDSYERQQTPMTGLPDLLEKFAVRLAAACDMPLTLLFGTSPAGMNATGESDVRFFYDRVAAYQRRKMEPALRRICQIIFRTMSTKREPDKWNIKFRPLWQDSTKDRAAAIFATAQADNLWVTMGAVSAEEVAASHWGKGEFDPNLSIDFEAREAQEQAAASPVLPEDKQALQLPDNYVPPPGPGSAQVSPDVPAPAPPSAPDPNTRPQPAIRSEDSANRPRRRDSEPQIYPAGASRAPAEVSMLDAPDSYPSTDVAQAVREQLQGDYDEGALDWIDGIKWEGPKTVPLEAIDYTGRESWRAASEPDKVHRFEKRIRGGWAKPIILIKRPGEQQLMIADGHHRAMAYWNLGRPVVAYVGTTPTDTGPWDEFHSQQHEKRHDEPEPGGIRQTALEGSTGARGDEWSDEAREAAAEARAKSAKTKDPAADKVSARAGKASEQAEKRGTRYSHEKAAGEHRIAGVMAAKAGNQEASQAHFKAAEAHQKAAGAARGAKPSAPKGPVASAPDHEHGPVPPPAGHAPAAGKAPVEHGGHGEGGTKSEQKHPAGSEGKHGGEHTPEGHGEHGGKGHGEGHGGHGEHGHGEHGHEAGKEFGEGLKEGLKGLGETVVGEKAAKVVGQLSPVGGEGGEGGEE